MQEESDAGGKIMNLRGLAVSAAFMAAILVGQQVVSAQSTEASAAPRTPWGAPDLGGVWDFRTTTPLERPDEFSGREELTIEETAAQKAQANEFLKFADAPPPEGDPGGYNSFWFDTAGIVDDRRTSLIVDPPDGKLPALKADAAHQVGSLAVDVPGPGPVRYRVGGSGVESPEARGLAERCILGFANGPPLTPGGYNQNIQLFQTAEYVVILNEMVHDPRIVALDGRPHLPEDMRQWNGDARGHWDGHTLVIESTNFTDQTASFAPNAAVAMGTGENLLLTERLSRVNADVMRYEFTVDDPTTFTRPFTAAIPLRRSEEPMYEYACHEGNYGLLNILRGAREDERAASETQP